MSKKCPILRTDNTDRLREKRTRGGEGVKKAKKSAYVLNGCSLYEKSPLVLGRSGRLLPKFQAPSLNYLPSIIAGYQLSDRDLGNTFDGRST